MNDSGDKAAGPQPNFDTALSFLQALRPNGPWTLTAIVPNGETFTDTVNNVDAARRWIAAHSAAGRNLYYALNPLRYPMSKKAAKQDVAAAEYLHADADPVGDETPAAAKARYRAALLSRTVPPPTFVVDSGNGLQMLWRLEVPVDFVTLGINSGAWADALKDTEARNKALLAALGASFGTHNIDRVLRLPGTINLLNAKKLKAGRVVCLSILETSSDITYPLEAFSNARPAPRPGPDGGLKTKPKTDKDSKRKPPRELLNMLYLTGDNPAEYATRSELWWAFVNAALRKGYAQDEIIELTLDQRFKDCSIFEHVQENKGAPYVAAQIAKAIEGRAHGKRIVKYDPGQLDMQWRETELALVNRERPVYVRGNELVWPHWREEEEFDFKTGTYLKVLSLQIKPYNLPLLRDAVGHHVVDFIKFDAKLGRYKPINPPNDVIQTLLTAKHWRFASLRGVIAIPTMRPDGSLLLEEGYDKRTGIYYKPNKAIKLPHIPDSPTEQEAGQQLEILKELLKEFRFENETSLTVALAAMMTVVLRAAFGPAPMFLITAPEPRSGKTYLAQLVGMISTGHIPINTAGSADPVEMEKWIETAALVGRSIIHLNNLPDGMTIDSMALAQMSSEGNFVPRLLGAHKEGEVDCRATTTFANGINIRLAAALTERFLLCRIDNKMADPGSRVYEHNPISTVQGDLGKYIAACLIVGRAYLAADKPKVPNRIAVAGFEGWERIVQMPLMWLGCADPRGNRDQLRAADPSRDELSRLLRALRLAFNNQGTEFKVADCTEKAAENIYMPEKVAKYPALRELMMVKGNIDGSRFGRMLNRHLGRLGDDDENKGWSIGLASADKKRGNAYRLISQDMQPPKEAHF
jgi:hypothetical protein